MDNFEKYMNSILDQINIGHPTTENGLYDLFTEKLDKDKVQYLRQPYMLLPITSLLRKKHYSPYSRIFHQGKWYVVISPDFVFPGLKVLEFKMAVGSFDISPDSRRQIAEYFSIDDVKDVFVATFDMTIGNIISFEHVNYLQGQIIFNKKGEVSLGVG